MRAKILATMAAANLILAGCNPQPVDVSRAQLMPDSVARSVLARYIGADWVAHPYVHEHECFRNQNRPVIFGTLAYATYDGLMRRLYIIDAKDADKPALYACDSGDYVVENVSQEQAQEIVTALVSLGAPIKQLLM